jgi:hypothetical protein
MLQVPSVMCITAKIRTDVGVPDFRNGSEASFWSPASHFRSTPISGRSHSPPALRIRANRRHGTPQQENPGTWPGSIFHALFVNQIVGAPATPAFCMAFFNSALSAKAWHPIARTKRASRRNLIAVRGLDLQPHPRTSHDFTVIVPAGYRPWIGDYCDCR